MHLIGLSTAEITSLLQSMGEASFRGKQVAEWIYRRGAANFAAMTNLSQALREKLGAEHDLDLPAVAAQHDSNDGSTKLLLQLHDGERVETVHLPYPDRISVCVSSQAGCAMACAFCATGLGGFRRNLTVHEIVAQPLLAARAAAANHEKPLPSHIVFMGMGEPLLNFQNVLQSVHLLHDEMGVPMRHITISTVGIVPGIIRLAAEKLQLTLAVSLHAPDDELRHRLIPTSTKTRVTEIVRAARDYTAQTGRRVTFEYVLLGEVNDHPRLAERMAGLCRGWPCHVNLIPWNAVPDAGFEGAIFHPPTAERVRGFRGILEAAGITVTQRVQRGADVAAACGQLRAVRREQETIQIAT